MQTHVLQEGDYLGACKGFAELLNVQLSTKRANSARSIHCDHDGSCDAQDESMHAGPPYNMDTKVMRSLSVTRPAVKKEGGKASMKTHIQPSACGPYRFKDQIFDTANVKLTQHSKYEDDLWLSMDAGELRDTNDNKNCYCCTANAMLSAVDKAVSMKWCTVAADRASAPSQALSPASLVTTILKGDTEDAGAISYLARYINMPGEDMRAMHRNGVTLGTLERLTTDDLLMLGMRTPSDAISLRKAATALATLRQIGAAAATEQRRDQ